MEIVISNIVYGYLNIIQFKLNGTCGLDVISYTKSEIYVRKAHGEIRLLILIQFLLTLWAFQRYERWLSMVAVWKVWLACSTYWTSVGMQVGNLLPTPLSKYSPDTYTHRGLFHVWHLGDMCHTVDKHACTDVCRQFCMNTSMHEKHSGAPEFHSGSWHTHTWNDP